MNKFFLSAVLLTAVFNAQSQNGIGDFEEPVLTPETAWYGQDQVTDGDTIYVDDIFTYELNYNSAWGSYSGWAVSNITDNTTPGWTNQYSSITGSGVNGSDQYGVAYVSDWSNNRIFFDFTSYLNEVQITNSTYAYYAMLNGEGVAKPFGADTSASGVIDGTNGEDWFLLTIYALGVDSLPTGDSINFYLADYRFADNSQDYIVDTWQTIDLVSLNPCNGLDFVLTSSDTSGGFGMNTPSYFIMDDLIGQVEGLQEINNDISIYPNPTQGNLNIENGSLSEVYLYDLSGKLIRFEESQENKIVWDLSDLDNGVYLLISVSNGEIRKQKIVKQ